MTGRREAAVMFVIGMLGVGVLRSGTTAAAAGPGSRDAAIDTAGHQPDAPTDDPCRTHRRLLRGALARHAPGLDDHDGDHPGRVARGRRAFDDRTLHELGANGRACADCHMGSDHFQLSPASATARFDALQACRAEEPWADDPLFRPIDANDFRANGENATDFTNLKQGLVRLSFALPPNVKLVGAAGQVTTETEVDVWRSVPSVRNVALTGPDGQLPEWPAAAPPAVPRELNGGSGPNLRGGYQLDARVGDLASQALGAFEVHAQIQSAPRDRVLSNLAAFQESLVTPAPSEVLTPEEQAGQVVFQRTCAHCHGGTAGSTPISQVLPAPTGTLFRYFDISSACPRPVDPTGRFRFKACNAAEGLGHLASTVRTYEITMNVLVNGLPVARTFRRPSSDPGRFLLTGYAGKPPVAGDPEPVPVRGPVDDWQKLDVSPLLGIADTAPYFHNNSATTLEEVVDHYEAFFKRVWFIDPFAPALTTTGPVDGLPNPDRLFGIGDPSCLAAPATSGQDARCPIPFGPEEKAALVAFLKVL
jgi:cytochrome c peroxidase